MGFCTKCAATLTEGSGYCGSCGSQVAPGIQGEAWGPQVVTTSPSVSSTGLTSNIAGALAYVHGLITGIVFHVLEPYKRDRFVRFHAMPSVLFCLAAFVFSIAWGIVVRIMISISGWTAVVLTPIGLVISLRFFLFWLFLTYQAYSQREYRIPFMGAIAAKQAAG
jgi:uncharacterized membrane protein